MCKRVYAMYIVHWTTLWNRNEAWQKKLMILYLPVKILKIAINKKKQLLLIEIASHSQWMEIAEISPFSSILLKLVQHNRPDSLFLNVQSSYMQFIIFLTSSDFSVPIHRFLCAQQVVFFTYILWSWSWFHNCNVIHLFIIFAAHDSGHNLPEDRARKMRPVLLTCDLNGCAHTHIYIQFIHICHPLMDIQQIHTIY